MRTAKQHLALYGVSTEMAFRFILDNLANPEIIYEVAQNYGISTRMLAEVINEHLPQAGITDAHVRQYFDANNLRGEMLEAKYFGGHEYFFVDKPMTWMQAREFAKRMHGDLVIINTPEENDFVMTNALKLFKEFVESYNVVSPPSNDGGSSAYVWLGGSDAEIEGKWYWVDGTPISLRGGTGYSNWGSVEPDDFHPGQDHLAMGLMSWPNPIYGISPYGIVGQWNDINGNNLMPFVVEFG